MAYERDDSIRLSVCYSNADSGIRIHAQVYDKNVPLYEIGQWALDEFCDNAQMILRAYQAGRFAEKKVAEGTKKG